MTVKTTGAEFKRFYTDPAFWPEDNGDTWHDDEEIRINGNEVEWTDPADILDSDVVSISGGIVYGPTWTDGNEPSLEGYFKQWSKQQTTARLLVECPKDKVEQVQAAIKAAGGKVRM